MQNFTLVAANLLAARDLVWSGGFFDGRIGVDGTLRNRMRGTPAENNLRGKTGSLSSASSLAGYVTTVGGEVLVFSIMVNNYPVDTDVRALCIDPIAVLLASFAGRS